MNAKIAVSQAAEEMCKRMADQSNAQSSLAPLDRIAVRAGEGSTHGCPTASIALNQLKIQIIIFQEPFKEVTVDPDQLQCSERIADSKYSNSHLTTSHFSIASCPPSHGHHYDTTTVIGTRIVHDARSYGHYGLDNSKLSTVNRIKCTFLVTGNIESQNC